MGFRKKNKKWIKQKRQYNLKTTIFGRSSPKSIGFLRKHIQITMPNFRAIGATFFELSRDKKLTTNTHTQTDTHTYIFGRRLFFQCRSYINKGNGEIWQLIFETKDYILLNQRLRKQNLYGYMNVWMYMNECMNVHFDSGPVWILIRVHTSCTKARDWKMGLQMLHLLQWAHRWIRAFPLRLTYTVEQQQRLCRFNNSFGFWFFAAGASLSDSTWTQRRDEVQRPSAGLRFGAVWPLRVAQ